ncbi:DUF4160 domain-containing protein [Bifidobacterium pullorum subsp. gallinarum]|uniref:DUF4160 domain-containing protein n=1 Tax=Bifidobacterium pullorum subsp. gallinarum TaxID=78344 RepID=A0A4P6DV83_9BIFI|nr:DUF4160 domain-containing protein [Bifidobacterium pullorum]QAY33107.1 DUF4160 domain-containing protein [Bifidobacterium pullorum subsp. gallinarum]
MPVISMFFGIIVRMYADDHNPPHVHVSYQGNEAAFTFDGELINGDLPRKQRHMVQGWIAMHEDDLRASWEIAHEGEQPYPIEPLK